VKGGRNDAQPQAPGGILIYDSAELSPPESDRYRSYAVPLTDMAVVDAVSVIRSPASVPERR